MRTAKSRTGFKYRKSRAGYDARPALTARLQQTGIPNLLDPNLQAAAFHQNGQWVVVPGPASPMYGKHLALTGAGNSYVSAPDSAKQNITGDIDIRVKVAMDSWSPPPSTCGFVDKFINPSAGYRFLINTNGTLALHWSDGTLKSISSSAGVSFANGIVGWVRVTFDVDDGAGNRVGKFYTSSDGISWTQLGPTATVAGTTSIAQAPSQPLSLGRRDNAVHWAGKIFYAEVRNGIDGTVVARFDPTSDAAVGTSSFGSSTTGEVWTVQSAASIRDSTVVQNSVANGFESTPFWPDSNGPMMAAKDITDVTAPFVAAADAQSLLGSTFWSGDHTVYVLCAPTLATSTAPVILSHGVTNVDGAALYTNATAVRAVHSGGATSHDIALSITNGALSKWTVASFGRSGANYFVRANGAEIAPAVTVTSDNPIAKNLYFGRNNNVNAPSRGPMGYVLFYNAAHSSAKKAEIEALLTGNYTVGTTGIVPITTTRGSAIRDVGPIEVENLIKRSEQPSDGAWTKVGTAVVVAGAGLAPDGVSLADQLSVDGPANATASVTQSVTGLVVSTNLAPQFWIKRVSTSGTVQVAHPSASANGQWNIDLSAIGTGWVQVKSGALPTGVTQINPWVTNATGQGGILFRSGGGVISFLVWGIGLNIGSTAGAYVMTYADPRFSGPVLFPAGDNARIAHPTKGLPCFTGTTNLLLQTEDYTAANWNKIRSTITANAATAPDRAVTADKLVEDASATTTHYVNQAITKAASAITYTFSVFLKAAERTNALFQISNNTGTGGVSAIVNLLTGALSAIGSSGTFATANPSPVARAESLGNGWWRVSITAISDTDTVIKGETYLHNGTSVTYTGDGASGLYVWGGQFEQASFATPYVPTTTASASSSNDVHRLSSSGWPTSNGEIELVYTPSVSGNVSTNRVLIDTRTQFPGDGVVIYIAVNGVLNAQQHGSNTQVGFAGVITLNAGQSYKFKYVWKLNVVNLYLDGVVVASHGSAPVPTTHHATPGLGCDSPGIGSIDQAQGHIRVLYIGKPR
jgi:hypothetical protein